MKVRASIKKRSSDCIIVRRKGVLYVVIKRTRDLNKDKVNNFKYIKWQGLQVLIYQKIKEVRLV